MPRTKPRTAGWEAWMLHMCYAAPETPNSLPFVNSWKRLVQLSVPTPTVLPTAKLKTHHLLLSGTAAADPVNDPGGLHLTAPCRGAGPSRHRRPGRPRGPDPVQGPTELVWSQRQQAPMPEPSSPSLRKKIFSWWYYLKIPLAYLFYFFFSPRRLLFQLFKNANLSVNKRFMRVMNCWPLILNQV